MTLPVPTPSLADDFSLLTFCFKTLVPFLHWGHSTTIPPNRLSNMQSFAPVCPATLLCSFDSIRERDPKLNYPFQACISVHHRL